MPERGQHARMVCGKATGQGFTPALKVEDLQIFFRDTFHTRIDDVFNLLCFLLGGQHHAAAQALIESAIAACTGEDEGDRRKHVLRLQYLQYLWAAQGAIAILLPGGAGASPSLTVEFAASATLVTRTRTKALARLIVRATIVGIAGLKALDPTL